MNELAAGPLRQLPSAVLTFDDGPPAKRTFDLEDARTPHPGPKKKKSPNQKQLPRFCLTHYIQLIDTLGGDNLLLHPPPLPKFPLPPRPGWD